MPQSLVNARDINTRCLATILAGICVFICSCSSSSGKSFYPAFSLYKEKEKTVYILPKKLLEISGHVVLGNGQFAAINDEDGEVILFDPEVADGNLELIPFGGNADYEDIVLVDSTYYVMESNGDIHIVQPGSVKSEQVKFSRDVKVEFESLVHYPDKGKLVLITKDHRMDEEAIYAFSFDLTSRQFDETPFFKIPMREIFTSLKDFSAECKPSAAAIHPILDKLFILASVGKVLLICSKEGRVEAAYELNPSHFQQPEGISFASNGDMYISNEGLQGKATLIRFPYQP